MKTSLNTKLSGGFLAVGIITLAVGLYGWHGIVTMQAIQEESSRTQEIAKSIMQRELDHLNWMRKVGQFQSDETLTSLGVEKDPHKCGLGQWYYGPGREAAEHAMPELRPLLAKLESPLRRLHDSAIQLEQILAGGQPSRQNAVDYYQTNTCVVLAEVQQILGELKFAVEQRAAEEQTKSAATSEVLMLAAMIAATSGFAFAFLLGLFLSHKIAAPIKLVASQVADAVAQTSAAAGQVSASSQTLAEGAAEQAASQEETSASLEEMASMTSRNAVTARKANDIARQAREAADKGAADMRTMSSAMESIKVSSDGIAKIIKTIDEITFQTNILALNAAVEAARAGEAGMGFAVVADEVRNLAQRCAQAAKETSSKIESAVTNAGQGVEISGKVAAALNDIVAKVRQVDELMSDVAGASREQTAGITQINSAVGQMDKVTQSNATTAEESAAAAQELNAQSEIMKQSVAELLELAGGNPGQAGPAAKPNLATSPAPPARSTSKILSARMNCWEFKQCGREAGGAKARELGVCPAYPDRGHSCATMAGTLCGGKVQGSFAQKITSCLQCKFYNSPNYERHPATPSTAVTAPARAPIPMDGEFKDF